MRPVRYYKNYSVTLMDFSHKRYKGTDIPKDFSSRIRLRNPQTAEDREVLIYMNNPLRYAGETYYQGGFEPGTVSILQVVRIRLVDSVSFVHIGWIRLGRALFDALDELRQANQEESTRSCRRPWGEVNPACRTTRFRTARIGWRTPVWQFLSEFSEEEELMNKRLPWILTAVLGVWLLAGFVPPRDGEGFHIKEFGRLPVLLNGRVQPFDSVARNSLLTCEESRRSPKKREELTSVRANGCWI